DRAPLAVLPHEQDRRIALVGRPDQQVLGEAEPSVGEEPGTEHRAVTGIEGDVARGADNTRLVPDLAPEVAGAVDAPAVQGDAVGQVDAVLAGHAAAEAIELRRGG